MNGSCGSEEQSCINKNTGAAEQKQTFHDVPSFTLFPSQRITEAVGLI
jgi:hypothetical protein